jgi:hypothetical protein
VLADEKLSACGLYDQFVQVIGDFLTVEANIHFQRDIARDAIPQEILTEMTGVIEGCNMSNPSTNVTMERLITLNYGCATPVPSTPLLLLLLVLYRC